MKWLQNNEVWPEKYLVLRGGARRVAPGRLGVGPENSYEALRDGPV